jgi:hypothetical protein
VVKKKVLVHLGEHKMPQAAMEARPFDIEDHRQRGRTEQATKLQEKLEKLRELTTA